MQNPKPKRIENRVINFLEINRSNKRGKDSSKIPVTGGTPP